MACFCLYSAKMNKADIFSDFILRMKYTSIIVHRNNKRKNSSAKNDMLLLFLKIKSETFVFYYHIATNTVYKLLHIYV